MRLNLLLLKDRIRKRPRSRPRLADCHLRRVVAQRLPGCGASATLHLATHAQPAGGDLYRRRNDRSDIGAGSGFDRAERLGAEV